MNARFVKEVSLGEVLKAGQVIADMTNRSKKAAVEDLVDVLYKQKLITNKAEAERMWKVLIDEEKFDWRTGTPREDAPQPPQEPPSGDKGPEGEPGAADAPEGPPAGSKITVGQIAAFMVGVKKHRDQLEARGYVTDDGWAATVCQNLCHKELAELTVEEYGNVSRAIRDGFYEFQNGLPTETDPE